MMKIPVRLALLIAMMCHADASIYKGSPQQHKFRHKHNLLHFNDQRVNEIREAFDDYKNFVVQKPKLNYDDVVKLKPLRHHQRRDEALTDELTQMASDDRTENGETSIANPQARYKRVHTAETTRRTTTAASNSDNYDEEYDDDEDDKANRKVNDESTKVQVSCVITRL